MYHRAAELHDLGVDNDVRADLQAGVRMWRGCQSPKTHVTHVIEIAAVLFPPHATLLGKLDVIATLR
jgi:hypothetical protein